MYKKNYNFKKGAKREKSEFEQKVLDIRRVTRVVAGGKRFRFRATVVLGDHKGRVGVGVVALGAAPRAEHRASGLGHPSDRE